MDKAKIDRINELAKKKKQEGLTFEETAEQNELRRQYIDEFKNSLRQQIESIKIIDDDGKALTAKQYNEQQKKKKYLLLLLLLITVISMLLPILSFFPFPAVVSFLPSVSGSRPMSCLIADEALLHSVGNAVWNNLTRQWILLQLRVRLSREMTKFVS